MSAVPVPEDPSPSDAGSFSSPGRTPVSGSAAQLKSAFRAIDEVLKTVERVAWEVRGAADEISDVWNPTHPHSGNNAGLDPGASPANRYHRMAKTAWVLAQMALSYRAHGFRSAFVSKEAAAETLQQLHQNNARRFREASLAHGGAFLKVGQLVSARHDILPPAWVSELSALQDDAPALPLDSIRPVIESDLGPLSTLFETFDESPLAAASIGQVHRARTCTGETVAVKVQRPGIDAIIRADLEMLGIFLESVRSMLPPTDFATIEREIRQTVEGETDYIREAEMMRRVGEVFSDHADIIVPEVVASHSSHRIISSQFVEGRKITQVLDELAADRDRGNRRAGDRLDRVFSLLLEAYVTMVLEAGIFQADPHPGNLLVTEDDRLVLLDFGATAILAEQTRQAYLELVRACLCSDRERMVELLHMLGFRTRSGRPDTVIAFTEVLLEQMRQAAQGGAAHWPTRDEFLKRTADLLSRFDRDPVVTLPREFVMIGRVFGSLGGLFSHYRPRVDYATALFPVLGRAMSVSGGAPKPEETAT